MSKGDVSAVVLYSYELDHNASRMFIYMHLCIYTHLVVHVRSRIFTSLILL